MAKESAAAKADPVEPTTAQAPAAPKRVPKASKSINIENGTVTFEFADGDKPLVVQAKDFPREVQAHATLHGFSQKIGDAYAGAESPEDARNLALAVVEQLKTQGWTQPRASGGGGSGVTILVDALARATGQDRAKCSEVVSKLDPEQQKALKKRPEVKAQVEAIKAERAIARQKEAEAAAGEAAGPSLDQLFAGG